MSQRVSPKSILLGDVIDYHGHVNLPEGETPDADIGIVVDVRQKDDKILGFDIIPLHSVPLSTYIEQGPDHYLLSRDDKYELEQMGLETRGRKYNAVFDRQIVLNAPTHLSTDGHGGVTRHGSLTGTQLIENILRKEMAFHSNHGGFLSGSKEMQRMGGYGDNRMSEICESHAVEAGKNIHIELHRQDAQDAEYFGDDGLEPL